MTTDAGSLLYGIPWRKPTVPKIKKQFGNAQDTVFFRLCFFVNRLHVAPLCYQMLICIDYTKKMTVLQGEAEEKMHLVKLYDLTLPNLVNIFLFIKQAVFDGKK
ncbi:MAG: hypothetical protein SOZ51_07445 [Eubacteriales bacterium]|nr:hypothetical protein [Eubacteriales bacterium]